jgi:ubiquinone/menaquinone biosynthesis C-methylase UbiE
LREADAGALPFEDARFDAVVSTLVLCSVPEQARTLAEVRRVLKPGGALRLLEHVRSDRPWALALQRTVNPAWGLVADGCHLDRDTLSAVRQAGFEVETVEEVRVDPPLKNLVIFARKPSQ